MTLLTEDEAREKWCPKARIMEYDQAGATDMPFAATVNRVLKWLGKDRGVKITWESCHCIASDCMAWRWESDDAYSERMADWAADNQPVEQGGPGSSGTKPPKPQGYCGAFGRPE